MEKDIVSWINADRARLAQTSITVGPTSAPELRDSLPALERVENDLLGLINRLFAVEAELVNLSARLVGPVPESASATGAPTPTPDGVLPRIELRMQTARAGVASLEEIASRLSRLA